MARFDPVPLPACEQDVSREDVARQIQLWISSAPMRALVAEFGGVLPDRPVDRLLTWLDDFSDQHWNFRKRGNVERDQVKAPEFTAETAALIGAAAASLHLVDPDRPSRTEYDHVLVLGGLGRACLQRTEYAAQLILQGATSAPELAALGSFRPLTDAEKALPGLGTSRYEADAMDVGVRLGFGFEAPVGREASDDDATPRSWEVRTYRAEGSPEVHVLAAPSSEPDRRRANTADTYEFWARRVSLRATDRVLVVTSPIYVPFQHSDAIRMLALPFGCAIDTIGFDPARSTVALAPGATNPDRYLQEIRSGIVSMRHLHNALAETYAR
jgi:hypothetical protein